MLFIVDEEAASTAWDLGRWVVVASMLLWQEVSEV
jgi:hypothetical protein